MSHQISYELTDELIRRMVRRLWPRQTKGFLIVVGGGWLVCLALLLLGTDDRIRYMLIGAVGVLTFLLYCYYQSYRRGGAGMQALQDRMMTVTFDDESVRVRRGGVDTTYRWETVERVLRYPEEWILQLAGGHGSPGVHHDESITLHL
ncbi:MAG TPA: YcxB family protein [Planctomycetaceae bacterium]|nr:YcxB family protein [Planctomycetaceae bacterium]